MAKKITDISAEEFLRQFEPKAKEVSAEDFLTQFEPLAAGTAPQVAGEVPTPSTFRKLLPTKEELPELGATVLTGLKMTGRRFPVVAGAMGLAASGGEIARQAIFEKEPLTPLERAGKVGMAFGRGVLGATAERAIKFGLDSLFKSLPKEIADRFLGTTVLQAKSAIAKEAETVGEKMLKTPQIVGTRRSVLNEAKARIGSLENQIQTELTSVVKQNKALTIKTEEVLKPLEEVIDQFESTGVNEREARFLRKIWGDFIEKHGDEISIQKANLLKRTFHEIVNDKAFLKGLSENPVKTQGMRTLAYGLRKEIAKAVPTLQKLNEAQGLQIAARDNLIQALAQATGDVSSVFWQIPAEIGGTSLAFGLTQVGRALPSKPISRIAQVGTQLGLQKMMSPEEERERILERITGAK